MTSGGLTLVGLSGPRGVSELVRLEKLLYRRDQEFVALAERAEDLITEFDRELRYVYVNPAIERLTGTSAIEFQGRRHDELGLPAEHTAMWRTRLMAAFASGQESDFEFKWLVTGEEFPREYQARLIPEPGPDGGIEIVLVISRDITERRNAERAARQAELYYRALIEDSLDLLAVLDDQGVIRYGSPSVQRLLGHTPLALIGMAATDLVHPDELNQVLASIAACLREPGVIHSDEFRLRQPGDRWRLFEVVSKGVVFGNGTVNIVLNGRDMTERRRLEAQLRQTQKIEAIGRLAGGIAHDFNNLLATILSNCELLNSESSIENSSRNGLDEITGAAQRAAGLTHQLLAFSRRQVLQPTRIDLNTVVLENQGILRELTGPDVTLECIPGQGLETVAVDRGQLEQVLFNLATNARDAMPEGGRLTISTSNAIITDMVAREYPGFRPGDYVVLAVRDSGVGMDAATASHVFEPFFTTKEPGKGSGLGLATVYGIVKQSGGYIMADTTLSRGTEFRIYLPRFTQSAVPELRPAPPLPPPVPPAHSGGESILLVEDELSVRKVTVRLLQRLGYQVLVADGPDQALALASDRNNRIDLVISDVVMPQMRGPTLVRALLEIRPGLRVIFVSGFALDASVATGGLEPGMGFLAKPFSVGDLGRMVRQQLDSRSAE